MTTLAEKVAFLRQPGHWPQPTRQVDVLETHWSFVFLLDTWVAKLKKPQKIDLLDLRALEDRHANCRDEVRLNRRLAPDVYLGIEPLVRNHRRLALGGPGEIVDWLVLMERLPADHMLDVVIDQGHLDHLCLRPAAERLARFHLDQPPVDVSPDAHLAWLRHRIQENRQALAGLDPRADDLCDALLAYLTEAREVIGGRVREGHLVDGHGDLRPEHICLDPPCIIDCLEFDTRLRQLDAVHELAFFALECLRVGDPDVGEHFLAAWTELSGDHPPADLVGFYTSHRALIRARLLSWRLEDPMTGDRPEDLRAEIEWYLDQGSRSAP